MHTINKDLAKIFEEMGCIYEFLGEENRFRAIAYHNAARALNDLPEDIHNFIHDGEFTKIHDVGESIEAKIMEYLQTNKIEHYEELKDKIPHDFIDLMQVQGLGPQTLKHLHDELNVCSKSDLLKVLKDGSLLKLKGFKQKKVDNILEGLNELQQVQERATLWDALDLSETIINRLREIPGVLKVDVAGSVRRGRDTIGDIDILVAAAMKDRKNIIRHFTEMEDVSKVLAKGDTKASIFMAYFKRQVDLRIVAAEEWGAALQYFTGSKAHNIHLRKIAIDKGLKINEYGLFTVESNKRIAGETEEGIYEQLGLKWIPPEMREDAGEIELSATGKIPGLISLQDIRGDMHTHSKWSDGADSLEEIADYAQKHLPYKYLVISDHSKSERIAGGMEEAEFRDQIREIKAINKKLGRDFLKAGAEVDIMADGTLDLPDKLLKELDWVIAAVHSQFRHDNTERIIKACQNPFVHAIAHPTGRILGTREGYVVDLEAVINAAASTGTALEINAHATRMDLNDQWTRLAREKQVMLVIGTDAHNQANYNYLKLGIFIARRAWCKPEHILNTREWDQVVEFKEAKLQRFKAVKS